MATLLSFLLVQVLSGLSACVAWNVSIDCGAQGSYVDGNSIQWIGDASFIRTGYPRVVDHNYRPFRSLREFATLNKNCYSIDANKGEQVLVRTSFYYGNYDNRSLPPTFELQLDGNYWAEVETELDQAVTCEAIYFVKGNAISVCVAQTKPNQLPFISALEVRSLTPDMYYPRSQDLALLLRGRFSFGASAIVRQPYDRYDRIWTPAEAFPFPTITKKEQSVMVNTSDYPPEAVLLSAAVATEAARFVFLFSVPSLPKDEVPIYMNMYFSEVDEQAVTSPLQNRTFDVYKNQNLISKEPIVPSYDSFTELTFSSNITASSETLFALVPTPESAYPPIINALEIFVLSDPITDGTHINDVEGLATLRRRFDPLQRWSGDPCLPIRYGWEWLNCSADISPRVISMNLSGLGLSGPLPDFSSMDALQYIYLRDNNLNGTIPDFLGNLPNLKELNLANNNFSGLIPTSLSNSANRTIVLDGNPDLCSSVESCKARGIINGSGNRRMNLPTTYAAAISILFIFWALCFS